MMVEPRLADGAVLCPHKAVLERHAIRVSGAGGSHMLLCGRCFSEIRWLIGQWHAYQIRLSTVFRRMRELDYGRFDALRFCARLVIDRAQVRVGILSRGQVDV